MRFLYTLSGNTQPFIKEYDISAPNPLTKGTPMAINSMVDKPAKMTTSAKIFVGLLDEDYETAKNTLNPKSGNTRAKINVSKGIYAVDAIKLTATSGSTTTFVLTSSALASVPSASLSGGKLVLVSKGTGSTNTDKIGDMRHVTSMSTSSSVCTITISSAGKVCAGDVYEYYPVEGFDCLGVDGSDIDNLTFDGTGKFAKVVQNDKKNHEYHVVFTKHLFD